MILPFSSPNLKKLVLQSAIGVSVVVVWVGYGDLLLEAERVEEEEAQRGEEGYLECQVEKAQRGYLECQVEVEEERLGRIPEKREREMGRGVQPIRGGP